MFRLEERVKTEATDGELTCRRAFALADELGVTLRELGQAASQAGVKIAACQLGCFK